MAQEFVHLMAQRLVLAALSGDEGIAFRRRGDFRGAEKDALRSSGIDVHGSSLREGMLAQGAVRQKEDESASSALFFSRMANLAGREWIPWVSEHVLRSTPVLKPRGSGSLQPSLPS